MPIFAVWQIIDRGAQLGVSAFGISLKGGKDPLAWMLALDLVLFLGGVTALLIVSRRRCAYDFGLLYCATALVVTIPAHFIVGSNDATAWVNIWVQYPLLIAFLVRLLRNRRRWATLIGERVGGGDSASLSASHQR